MKSQEMTNVIAAHPEGIINVRSDFRRNPSDSCWGISIKTTNVNLMVALEGKSGDSCWGISIIYQSGGPPDQHHPHSHATNVQWLKTPAIDRYKLSLCIPAPDMAPNFPRHEEKAKWSLEGSWGGRVLNAGRSNWGWPHAGLDVRPESIPDSAVVWWRSNEHQAETRGT